MCDLLSILPNFPLTAQTNNILSSLEKDNVTTADLLTLEPLELSRKISVSLLDIRRFTKDVIRALHHDLSLTHSPLEKSDDGSHETVIPLGLSGFELWRRQKFISTTDATLDKLLGGGIMTGGITEIVGESGAGKTQMLLQLCCAVQLPPSLGGLSKTAVYISTEAPLPTTRLAQLLESFQNRFADNILFKEELSMDHILSITCGDLESQEHIVQYQLPVVVEKYNVGIIILDSVASNFRAEYEGGQNSILSISSAITSKKSGPALLAERGKHLVKLGHKLRSIARMYDLAVVAANQVSDRFESPYGQSDANDMDALSLDHQARWFTGWGDENPQLPNRDKKTPALGLVWANCIGTRIAILKTLETNITNAGHADEIWCRRMKLVFSPWAEGGRECRYIIEPDGVKGLALESEIK